MWYYAVMFFLIAGSAGMIGWTWKSVKNENRASSSQRQKKTKGEDEYRESQGEPGLQKDRQERRPRRERSSGGASGKKRRRQWKILLEDIDSWDKYSFIFYDSVGIGRTRDKKNYERFLEIHDDKRISKVHCAIVRKGEQLYLSDEGSRNGTYLNSERVDRPVLIEKGDLISIGGTRLEIQKILRESE